jgi:hypothetical protein
MALLPAGHLNSLGNVGIHQAGRQGSRHWAWVLKPGLGVPSSSSGHREVAWQLWLEGELALTWTCVASGAR